MRVPIYMDYQATTPADRRVVEAMLPYFTEKFGNPASRQHQFGWHAEEGVESARSGIAKSIDAAARDIVFTSGATESNNLAIKGIAETYRLKGNHIVTVQTEHKSVLDVCRRLENRDFRVTYLPVDGTGVLDLQRLTDAMTDSTILVSVMAANNEIGTLQDLAEIGRLCASRGVLFHTDATQALGKIPINVRHMAIDLLSASGHKIYGPKGVGILYVRGEGQRVRLAMQLDGGGHERGRRSGTLNVPGIVGMGKAVEIAAAEMEIECGRLSHLRDVLYQGFAGNLDGVHLNGHPTKRLPNNLNVSFDGVEANTLMLAIKEIALSTGSACSTADSEPSHVLRALHLPKDRIHSAVRFGLGRPTTEEEVRYVIDTVTARVNELRTQSHSKGVFRTTVSVPNHSRGTP